MDAAITHVQENPVAYGVILACLFPLLYITRRWTGPIFFHGVEIVLYSAIFHLTFAGAVRFLAWFREASEFRYWETDVNATRMTTPIANFWMKDQYSPEILFYIECVAFAIIVFIVVYFRPMNLGAKNRYKSKIDGDRKRPAYGNRRKQSSFVTARGSQFPRR